MLELSNRACSNFQIARARAFSTSDAQHIVTVRYLHPLGVELVASGFKTSTGEHQEVTVIPFLHYKGRSLRPAFNALIRQMGKCCLLANPGATSGLGIDAPVRESRRRCTSTHAIELLQAIVIVFQEIFQRSTSVHADRDIQKATHQGMTRDVPCPGEAHG